MNQDAMAKRVMELIQGEGMDKSEAIQQVLQEMGGFGHESEAGDPNEMINAETNGDPLANEEIVEGDTPPRDMALMKQIAAMRKGAPKSAPMADINKQSI